MTAEFPRLQRFIAAIHRRAVVLRVIERMGLLAAAAAIIAVVFLLIGLHADLPRIQIVAALIGIGLVAGLTWGVLRRPSHLHTAFRADRQLSFDDLLGTAIGIFTAGQSKEGWAHSVLATADAACARRSSKDVTLHRLGSRAWGGIALAVAMAFTIALLTATESPTSPPRHSGNVVASASSNAPRQNRALVAIAPESPLGTHVSTGAEDQRGPDGQPNPDRKVAVRPPDSANDPSSTNSNPGAATAGDPGGKGSGFGKTNPSATPVIAKSPNDFASANENPSRAANAQRPAGGAVQAVLSGVESLVKTTTGSTGRTAASIATASPPTPPWRSDQWTTDVQTAQQQLGAGQIAPQYRDLVRKYFEK
jgi:hypothetical protein